MNRQANLSLERLLPRLRVTFEAAPAEEWTVFETRLAHHFETLFTLLLHLYGARYDFFYHLESILATAARMWLARSPDLKALDAGREAAPRWFQSQEMLGGVCYVDLFAGNLAGVRARIPYFKELGLTYLHLMPLFKAPMPENDAPGECQLSYNPLLMATLWESLATRDVRLLQRSMQERFKIAPACAWVNYVRCHDDIGWTFDDGDAARVGIYNGYNHRQFLDAFYTGRFPGSFARGLPFQENPKTGDCRISGTCASLAGLEEAIQAQDAAGLDLALRRILLIHSVILSVGGIPLLYLGDELGTLNNYGYRDDPAKAADSRWVHRPFADWATALRRDDPTSIEGRVFGALRRMVALRKGCAAFAGNATAVFDTGNGHVFGFVHRHGAAQVLVLANFSEGEQVVAANMLRTHGLGHVFDDLITGDTISCARDLVLAPYRFVWLVTNA